MLDSSQDTRTLRGGYNANGNAAPASQVGPRRDGAADSTTWAKVRALVVCDKAVTLAEVSFLDVAAEVCCVEPGQHHGSWAGSPMPAVLDEEGFCLRPLPNFEWPSGERIVDIPRKGTHSLLGQIPQLVSNEVFLEVRYGLRLSALPHFHFDDVRDGLLRIFVIPDDETCEHRVLAVAEEDAAKEALAAPSSQEVDRLIRFLHNAAAPPDRWASTLDVVLGADGQEQLQGTDLFPHQLASIRWMLAAEREEIVQAKTIHFAGQIFGSDYEVKLPAGGVLAHPPGAGKTRIVAAFIKARPCFTTILCPPHLIDFWREELASQGADAEVVAFGTDLESPGRLVLDEPQDLEFKERVSARCAAMKAKHMWLVCGTPHAYTKLLGDFLLGRGRCHQATTVSEFAGQPEWPHIFQNRFLADPPAVCLPRPPLDVVDVSVTVGMEGIDAAVAGLSGYIMDQMLYLTFGRAATAAILERARILNQMGYSREPCHEITLADWDAAVAQHAERRAARVAERLATLEAELNEQQAAFANRDDFEALHDLPAVLHVDGAVVVSAPAEWNAAWAGQTLEAKVGGGVFVSSSADCATCCRSQHGSIFAIFVSEEALPIGYAPNEGAPPIPAVRIAAQDAALLRDGACVKLEIRQVSILDEEAGIVTQEMARDGIDTLLWHEVQHLRTEKASMERVKSFAEQVRGSLATRSSTPCPICLEESVAVAILPNCAHAFCRACFERSIGVSGDPGGAFACPVCRCESLRRDVVIFRHDGAVNETPRKLVRLVQLLKELEGEKVLVFMQWTANLDSLRQTLLEHGIEALSLAGDLPTTMDALRRFSLPEGPDVLLLSFQRHASGINLQFCRHVVILHPYCSETASDLSFITMRSIRAYETQAIGRVRRYPQTGLVRVYRFFAACSLEEEIYSMSTWNRA
eukprot:TRINITY_DN101027_c0_g1_i1.p1 TRINITY_DN101027_c0_g1~~TRINITY_DN101027_c0_g1_i1.p1  ORF type:complete len:920 (+),score=74.32 TRINITY_DN101027_c0_g1_i1:94-2853(+)